MSNQTRSAANDFMRVMLESLIHDSSSYEKSREYLIEEGQNPDLILQEGMNRIAALKDKIAAKNSVAVTVTKAEIATRPQKRNWFHKSVKKFIEETGNPDPIEAMRKKIRDLVVKAFELGWEGPPFSPVQFAKFLNLEVTPNDSVIDARILPQEDCFHIQYNPFQMPTRINFSVAHEIVHTVFSDCAESVRYREEKPLENRELEQLCNIGASEILLPYAVFSHDATEAHPSIDGLIGLATKYKASLEAIFLRYTEVIDVPCIVMIGVFQSDSKIVIDYFKTSKFSNVNVPFNFELPEDSKTYECIAPGNTARETVRWDYLGESYELSAVGISPYKRDNKPRVGMILFPNKHVNTLPELRKIILETGDATIPGAKGKKIIAQVVNTSASFGRGFGYSLAKRYPMVTDAIQKWKREKGRFVLGSTNLVTITPSLFVFQMLAQKGLIPRGDEVLLKYEELRKGLIELRETALRLHCSVHMPAIGAGNARGDWNIIIGMIHDELINYGIKVHIYFLKNQPFNPNHKTSLTVYKVNKTWEKGKLF